MQSLSKYYARTHTESSGAMSKTKRSRCLWPFLQVRKRKGERRATEPRHLWRVDLHPEPNPHRVPPIAQLIEALDKVFQLARNSQTKKIAATHRREIGDEAAAK